MVYLKQEKKAKRCPGKKAVVHHLVEEANHRHLRVLAEVLQEAHLLNLPHQNLHHVRQEAEAPEQLLKVHQEAVHRKKQLLKKPLLKKQHQKKWHLNLHQAVVEVLRVVEAVRPVAAAKQIQKEVWHQPAEVQEKE